jgi:xanthine dehydrogenase small subunit
MKKTISFFLNGTIKEIQVKAETTVLELLRNSLELNGIKEGCGEGDCGACTVVIGEVRDGKVHYKSAAGCLYLAAKLDGKHVITIEGLGDREKLHPIQEAILKAHATQCGFCTPGVSLSILALYLERKNPTREEFRRYLEGNLCRCTGYVSIRKVPEYLEELIVCSEDIRPNYLTETEEKQMNFIQEDIYTDDGIHGFYSPVSEENLLDFLQSHPEFSEGNNIRFLNGGSDVVVGIKKHGQHYRVLLDLSRIETLQKITYDEKSLTLGGGVSLARMIDTVRDSFPEFSDTMLKMCSEQVRSIATVAGNIANASPVADTVPLLMAVDATLTINGGKGLRTIPVREFFKGYKKLAKQADEWISSITIPLEEYNFIHFEKVSKRREVDISSVNSAIALKVENGIIKTAHVASGGVGATTLYMKNTSGFLEGRKMKEETFLEAFEIIATEAAPIGDVRGSAEYRKAVLQNLLMKHYLAYEGSQEVDGHEE